MEITLIINEAGEMIVSANGQETPVASIDEALESIRALAEEAAAGAQMGGAPMQGDPEEMPEEPTPEQATAEEDAGMLQGFRGMRK